MELKWLPNALTVLRSILAFAVAGAVVADALVVQRLRAETSADALAGNSLPNAAMLALALFVLAGLTDLLDGVLARALDAASAFGAWLDPIADKLLVGLVLGALALVSGSLALTVPAAVIIARDGWITWLRARLGGGHALPVMAAAKWKTALEMAAIALLLASPVAADAWLGPAWRVAHPGEITLLHPAYAVPWRIGVAMAWLAAGLSVWTGLAYWRAVRRGETSQAREFD